MSKRTRTLTRRVHPFLFFGPPDRGRHHQVWQARDTVCLWPLQAALAKQGYEPGEQIFNMPETGEPVRRIFAEPNAPRAWTDTHAKASMNDRNLASKGFTKYVKTDKGTYEKTTGDGPKTIKRGQRP